MEFDLRKILITALTAISIIFCGKHFENGIGDAMYNKSAKGAGVYLALAEVTG